MHKNIITLPPLCQSGLNFLKFQLKWKIVKHFTRLKQRAALRKSFSLHPSHPHQIKPYYVSGTKIFLRRYIEIYRHLLSICSKNAVLGCQEMMQHKYFFWDQTETCLLQSQKGFWLCCGSILFSLSSKLRFLEWVRLFEQNKMCDLFC